MGCERLNIFHRPELVEPRMLLGFSGWMDGGDVSTGTVRVLVEKLGARRFAEIDPEGFYIYSFPGSMEMTALFRPHTKIQEGLIRSYEPPRNTFYCSESHKLILFLGKEPNLLWKDFADCIFTVCTEFGVKMLYFIGSVAGLVPHTREPRLLCSVSNEALKETFEDYGLRFTNYEGPASFITFLTSSTGGQGICVAALVAAIPAYVQGNNPKCIGTVTRKLAGILGLQIELEDLRHVSDEFEKRLSDAVGQQPELAKSVQKLEEDYDNEVFDSEMGDLKQWLQQQGIRLD
jgi:proteasome assembly chaperone (PAC2) family protein